MNRRRHHRRFRDASVTMEFILILPFLVVTLFAVAQYTVALLFRQAVTHAATVGAREAGKGESIEEVARAVDAVLEGAHGIDVATVAYVPGPPYPVFATVGPVANSGVRIALEVGSDPMSPYFFGDASMNCTPPATPVVGSDEVRVTVCFKLDRTPSFNWLYKLSSDYVNFAPRVFRISSLVKKESP